jgi:ferric-dicitrate binding protein FerR (iron transport regulator)
MSGRGKLSLLASALLLANLHAVAAGPPEASRALGYIAAKGNVLVDKQPAPSGTTLYAGDVVTTGEASAAILNLQTRTAATLSENSEVALLPGTPSGQLTLRRGTVLIRSEGSQPVRVTVSGASVLVKGEEGFPALCRIAFVGGQGVVFAQRGRVEVNGRGTRTVVPPGQSARLEVGSPQAAGDPAGKVSNAIPDAVAQRQGQGPEITIRINDGVNWEDVVRTLRTGRVRIALLDGSFLNVGARSTMRITRHDPQSQQTEVELRLGRLRGEVVKLTKAGSSFQVRTQTAVIGVVGTVFTINALPNLTQVSCLQGNLTVSNINPGIQGTTELNAGQSANVPATGPPSPPVGVSTASAVQEVAQTSAGEAVSTQVNQALQAIGATPAQVGSTVAQAVTTTAAQAGAVGANAVATGMGAASATMSGVAVSQTGDAQENISQAQETLNQAVTAAEDAGSAASDAANTATGVGSGVQDLVEVLSPSAPGCGCVE